MRAIHRRLKCVPALHIALVTEAANRRRAVAYTSFGNARAIELAVDFWENTGNTAYSMVQILDLMNGVVAMIMRGDSPKLTVAEVRPAIHRKCCAVPIVWMTMAVRHAVRWFGDPAPEQNDSWLRSMKWLETLFRHRVCHYHVRGPTAQLVASRQALLITSLALPVGSIRPPERIHVWSRRGGAGRRDCWADHHREQRALPRHGGWPQAAAGRPA